MDSDSIMIMSFDSSSLHCPCSIRPTIFSIVTMHTCQPMFFFSLCFFSTHVFFQPLFVDNLYLYLYFFQPLFVDYLYFFSLYLLTAFFLLSGAALFLDLVVEEKTKKVKKEDGDDGVGVDDDGHGVDDDDGDDGDGIDNVGVDDGEGVDNDGVDDGYGVDDDDGYDGVHEEGKHLNMKHEDKLWRQMS